MKSNKEAKPIASVKDILRDDGLTDIFEANTLPGQQNTQHVWAEPQLFLLPFCAPQHRTEDRLRTIKVVETVNVNGVIKERKFKVIPDPDFGLPSIFDFEVMIVIYQIAASELARTGCVPETLELPTFRKFLELMGRPGDGRYIAMLKESLKRLAATNCVSEGFFYSKPRDFYLIENFQFLTAAHLVGEDDHNGGRFEKTTVKPHSFIRENLNANFRTLIDFEYIRSLQTDIAKPLSLHLLYRFFKQNKSVWETDYDWIAERLAIRIYQDLKRAKDQLKPALQELKKTGFIDSWEWLPDRRIRFIAGPTYVKQHSVRVKNKDLWLTHQENEAKQLQLIPAIKPIVEQLKTFDPLVVLCAEYAVKGWNSSVAKKAKQKNLTEEMLRQEAVSRGHILKSL